MQKLDKTHCKALSFFRLANVGQVAKVRRRTSIGLHDLRIMEIGHGRGEERRDGARGGRGDRGDGGEDDEAEEGG
jgi:hypothetical protein